MTQDDCKFKSAFKFGEIFNKIRYIGWINLIKWYFITGIIYLTLLIIGNVLIGYLSLINPIIAGVIYSFAITAYANIYLFRSTALVYSSK